MIKVTYKVNGREINPDEFVSEMEKAILPAVTEKAIEVVQSKLTEEEQEKIVIEIQGDSLDDLSMNVRGPEEIIDKLTQSLE